MTRKRTCVRKSALVLALTAAAGVLGALIPAEPAAAQNDAATPYETYRAEYLESARVAADQNRYLVKGGDAVAPAPNMEPRMWHCQEIADSWKKLRAGGFCAPAAAPETFRQCPQLVQPRNPPGCRRPNILVFLVDDMGWSDFGPYGGGEAHGAATPNVDALAEGGLLLTSTYAQPSCSPTRATIHTGQLPIHHGVLSPPMYGDPGGLSARSVPLTLLLKKQGYVTRGVGKWHLGEAEQNLPSNNGYDEYLGFLNVSDMYTEWRDSYYNPEVAWDRERTAFMDELNFSHYMIRDSVDQGCESVGLITLPQDAGDTGPTVGNYGACPKAPGTENKRVSIGDLDQIWAQYSSEFIRSRKDEKEPWFLYHATRGCHFDNYPRDDYQRASYARTDYSDCMVEMDQILGALMQALEESGQTEETLVFFTSDNGPEQEIDPHGATPFRGGKGDTWEGGVRVPGIVHWPGMIESRRSDGLFDLADLYPTVLSFAGFDYATASKEDPELAERYLYGIEQTSFLVADRGASNRRSLLYWYLTNFAAVRMDEFKAHRMVSEPVGLHKGNIGGLSGVDLEMSYMWLFNLQSDPKEEKNIFIRHLWNQGLFKSEIGRFMCVLFNYPPNLPTEPQTEVMDNFAIWLLENNRKGIDFCSQGGQA